MKIFNDGLIVSINVTFWSGAKALTPNDIGLESIPDSIKLGRKMLIPSNVIKAFRAIESRARFALEKNSFKFPIGCAARFVPEEKMAQVLKVLNKSQFEYIQLTEQLIVNYSKYKKEMLPKYKKIADTAFFKGLPADAEFYIEKERTEYIKQFMGRIKTLYPKENSLREKFSLNWDTYEITYPRKNEAYKKDMEEKVRLFLYSVIKDLRQETKKICENAKERIQEGLPIKGQTISALNNFIAHFQGLNFIGDKKIEIELQNIQGILYKYRHKHKIANISIQEFNGYLKKSIAIASHSSDIYSIITEYANNEAEV